jgi:hypothetical protein
MGGPMLLAIGVLLILAGATGSTLLLRPDSRLDAAVTLGVMASAATATAMLAAGIAGVLEPAAVLVLLGAWALGAGLAAWRWGRPFPPIPTVDLASWRRHPWTATLVALAAVALVWQVLIALVLPPYAYDGLTYRLSTVATWVQSGTIAPSALSLCCAHYPFTPELLIALPALLLGNDSLVDIVQAPFVLLAAAATAGLARSMGLSRSAAAAAGALFASTPAVLTQASADYVDLMLAAFALAGLNAVSRYAVTAAPQRLVVAALAAGLALGTKGIGLIWAVALGVVAIAAAVNAVRRGQVQASSARKTLLLAAAVTVIIGGWWYVRNFATTGNPLYPYSVRLLGWTLFPGPKEVAEVLTVPSAGADDPWPVAVVLSWASDLDFWNQGSYDYQQRLGGLGPVWVWLGLPLLAVMVAVLVRGRQIVALLPLAAVGLVFVIQPYSWWARFTLPLASLGAIAAAWAASTAPWRWVRIVLRLSALFLAIAGVLMSSYTVDPAGRAADLPATRVVALIGSSAEKRSLGRLFHTEYAFLDRVPEHATIVVDTAAEPVRFISPLFGPRFTRRVLPFDGRQVPRDAWVVSARDRPLDRQASATHVLVWDVREIRVWRPKAANRVLKPPGA